MDYILMLLPTMLGGARMTLALFALTLLIALPLGLPVALAGISRVPPLRWLARTYVWLFRGTPLLLQLFFVYYGLPILYKPLAMDRFPAAVVTFVLNYAAYFAEIYRSGVQSIDRGQYEAAKSLGYSRWQSMYLIILPQVRRRIIPPVCNEAITLVKDTALMTAIAVPELLKAARDAVNRDGVTTAYLVAAVMYLVLTFVLTVFAGRLERKYGKHELEEEHAAA